MFPRPKIADARGNQSTVCAPMWRRQAEADASSSGQKPPYWHQVEALTLDFAAQASRRPSRLRDGIVLTIILALWAYGLFEMFRHNQKPLFSAGFYVLCVGAIVSGIIFARTRWRAKNADAIVELMLDRSLCPSCLYSLQGLIAEQDGCVVCPECGSAWNSPGGITS